MATCPYCNVDEIEIATKSDSDGKLFMAHCSPCRQYGSWQRTEAEAIDDFMRTSEVFPESDGKTPEQAGFSCECCGREFRVSSKDPVVCPYCGFDQD